MRFSAVLFAFLLIAAVCASQPPLPPDIDDETPPAAQSPFQSPAGYAGDRIIVKFRKPAATLMELCPPSPAPLHRLRISRSLDALNTKFRAGRARQLFKNFHAKNLYMRSLLTKNPKLLSATEQRIARRIRRAPAKASVPDLDRIYQLQLYPAPGLTIDDAVQAYNASPDVEYAEPDYTVSTCLIPNDPLFPIQWPLDNIGQYYPASGNHRPPPGCPDSDIDATDAWDKITGSLETVIAVIDTGVDYNHRDLVNNIWVNTAELNGSPGLDDDNNGFIDDVHGYDFLNNDPDPIDDHGHGTHCSGIIAAQGNNNLDITGICWNARIMPLKFLSAEGTGPVSAAVQAIYYAVLNGADVTSNSWGGEKSSQVLQDAIKYAHTQGLITVAAAGNRNTDLIHFPAGNDFVFAVAATDSNDDKASFSSFGPWVDIAAPGVDILSLRATGMTVGTPYDPWTTIASGTSMACPHVAGACGLLVSIFPAIEPNEILRAITESADPVDPNICASGRLNIDSAIRLLFGPKGTVSLDNSVYSCSDLVSIDLFDADLKTQTTQSVLVSTDAGDYEIVHLTQKSSAAGTFTGSIATASRRRPRPGDGILQVADNQVITITYDDTNDGSGGPTQSTASAVIDCSPPVISGLAIDAFGPEPVVTFQTNEPAKTQIFCGTRRAKPNDIIKNDPSLATSHTIKLTGVLPETTYYFIIIANNAVGNQLIDTNSGRCYSFSTDKPGIIHIPADYPTIQQAIDHSWNTGIVSVADGLYTGTGNRNINFKGKAITVKSANGPANCVIDCQASPSRPYCAFIFVNAEQSNSVLDGFTITNGFAPAGGAIYGGGARPAIKNCRFIKNHAEFGGALIYCYGLITSCSFYANSADHGGAIYSCNAIITNSLFTGNCAEQYGGALKSCHGLISNCTFTGNKSSTGGALYDCDGLVANSIIWNNRPDDSLGAGSALPVFTCIESDLAGTACFRADPCFTNPGHWDPNGTSDPADDFWTEGDYSLKPSSPCIDTGQFAYCIPVPSTDLFGNTRLTGAQIDLGCYETNSTPDSDADWLPDDLEPAFAHNPDRDSDAIPDGLEFIRGTDPNSPDALGTLNVPADADSVRQALFLARDGEKIILEPGTYRENLHLAGRNIVLTSSNPYNPAIIKSTIVSADTDADPNTPNGRAFAFLGTEPNSCRILGLTITGGSAPSGGGSALWGRETSATIANCVITRNFASLNSNAVHRMSGSVSNCLISANSCNAIGWCNGSFTNCTVVGNSGAAMFYNAGPVTNCVFAYNSPGRIPFIGSSEPAYSCLQPSLTPPAGPGSFVADPCFIDPGFWNPKGIFVNGDYHLRQTSPCVNAGDPNFTPDPAIKDLDGRPRVIGSRIDIGAFEFDTGPVRLQLRLLPPVIRPQARFGNIIALIYLPPSITEDAIDPAFPLTLQPGNLLPRRIHLIGRDKPAGPAALLALFDKAEFLDAAPGPGQVLITIEGRLKSGQSFYASATITILSPHLRQSK